MWVSISLNGNTVYTLRVQNYEDFDLIQHVGGLHDGSAPVSLKIHSPGMVALYRSNAPLSMVDVKVGIWMLLRRRN